MALTKRNALFAGSTDGAKTRACIAEALHKILARHLQRDAADLSPRNFHG